MVSQLALLRALCGRLCVALVCAGMMADMVCLACPPAGGFFACHSLAAPVDCIAGVHVHRSGLLRALLRAACCVPYAGGFALCSFVQAFEDWLSVPVDKSGKVSVQPCLEVMCRGLRFVAGAFQCRGSALTCTQHAECAAT